MSGIGIDVGSQTVKLVVTDDDGTLQHAVYRRHNSDIRKKLREAIEEYIERYGNASGPAAVTGSGGIAAAEMLGLPFVQEVMATTYAVQTVYPEADVVIELGGEDAKIVYLDGVMEQRMNMSCAGGTGSCIDSVAALLGETPHTLNLLAQRSQQLYPLPSRCAVFTQGGVRALLNLGVAKEDIAASAMDSVVRQTIGGLACGRPIRGNVVFLGGPFQYFSSLYQRFCDVLGLDETTGIRPEKAHLFTARGAAIAAQRIADDAQAKGEEPANSVSLTNLVSLIAGGELEEEGLERLEPLFADEEERMRFVERHKGDGTLRIAANEVRGPLYLGIDAGAAAVKGAVVDSEGRLCATFSCATDGDVLTATADTLESLYAMLPPPTLAPIVHATVTGSGEEAVQAIMGIDSSVVDTIAHAKAAAWLDPQVELVIDCGGQDMKALRIAHGDLAHIDLNDPCSSGCGIFLEETAGSLGLSAAGFDEEALASEAPVDLDTKCIVFMNSRLRHAQKVGASKGDIVAGLAYAVARNIDQRLAGRGELEGKTGKVLVQGGLFDYDAVLRAFEKTSGTEVRRAPSGQYMGAIGAALTARERAEGVDASARSTVISADALSTFDPIYSTFVCPGCDEGCVMSVVSYGDYQIYVSGDECRKGAEIVREESLKLGEHDILGSSSMIPRSRGNRRQRHTSEIGNGIVIPGYERSFSGGMVGGGGSQGIADEPRRVDYYAIQLERDRTRERKIKIIAPTKFLSAEDVARKQQEKSRAEAIEREEKERQEKLREREERLTVVSSDRTLRDEGHVAPNMIADEQEALASYGDHVGTGTRAATVIGLTDALDAHGYRPFWHTLLTTLGYSVLVPDDARTQRFAALSGESVPSESMCEPARIVHRRIYEMADRGANALFMPVFTEEGCCPVLRGSARAVAENVPSVLEGKVKLASPVFAHGADELLSSAAEDEEAIRAALEELGPATAPTKTEIREALAAAREAQRAFEAAMDGALQRALSWLHEDAARQGAVLVCRPYQTDAGLLHGIDRRIASLDCAVIAPGARGRFLDVREKTKPGEAGYRQRLDRLASFAAADDQLVAVFLEAFNCGFDRLAVEEATYDVEGGPYRHTTIALDETSDDQHIDIRLRTLIEGTRGEAELDALSGAPQGVCHTMAVLFDRAYDELSGDPSANEVHLPPICRHCLLDGLAGALSRRLGRPVSVFWDEVLLADEAMLPDTVRLASADHASDKVRIGIVGNPLLCFDPSVNGGIVELIEGLDAVPVLPRADLLIGEDARYDEQLRDFAASDVDAVLYLRNYDCLKGHVDGSGALHALQSAYPDMPVIVLDVDPGSSALNRENRIRLAISSAQRRRSQTAA